MNALPDQFVTGAVNSSVGYVGGSGGAHASMPALGDPDNDKETTVGRFVFRATVITLADVRRRLSHGNSSLLVQRLDKVRGISVAIVRQNFDPQKSSTLCDALQYIEPTRNEANDNAHI
jgi:hypothetical protein